MAARGDARGSNPRGNVNPGNVTPAAITFNVFTTTPALPRGWAAGILTGQRKTGVFQRFPAEKALASATQRISSSSISSGVAMSTWCVQRLG